MRFPSRYCYGSVIGCVLIALNASADSAVPNPNAASPNAGMRYVAVSTQHDSADNNQTIAMLSHTLGRHAWARAGVGTSRIQQGNDSIEPTLGNIGFGLAGRQLTFAVDASRRKQGDRYQQRDWQGSLEWHNNRVSLGVDGLHRNTQVQGSVLVPDGQGNATSVSVAESLRGNGWGVHGRVNVTERFSLFAGMMDYDYDVHTRQSGTVTTTATGSGLLPGIINNVLANRPLLAQQLLVQTSGATREAAILRRSVNAGAGYRFGGATFTARYFNDKAFDSGDRIDTVELSAAVIAGEHWTLSPAVGHSQSDRVDGVTYGSLTISYGW